MSFQQIWNESQGGIDLGLLLQELPLLRGAMRKDAAEPSHDKAVASIAAAEEAAKGQNGPAVIEHLQKAGKWAFEMCSKLGLNVATAAPKKALGL